MYTGKASKCWVTITDIDVPPSNFLSNIQQPFLETVLHQKYIETP